MKTLLRMISSRKNSEGMSEKKAILCKVFYTLMRAMDKAEDTSEIWSPWTCETVKKVMKEEIDEYVFEYALKQSLLWEESRRFMTAMGAMVDAEDFALKDFDDVRLMHFAFSAQLYMVPELVEHYVDTGEFMDVLSLLAKSVPLKTLSSKDESVLISEFDVLRTHSRLRALYDFDMQRHKELEHQGEVRGDDENFVLQLPLEIRMNFAQTHEGNSGGMSP